MKQLYQLIDGKTAILSTKKHSAVSDIIAVWTEADKAKDVSHSAILRADLLVTEARGDIKNPSVVNTPFADIIGDSDLQYMYISIPKRQPDPIDVMLWCNYRVGRPYDFANLGLIQFPKWISWAINPFQQKTKQAEKRYICSELANHCVRSLFEGCARIFSRKPIAYYSPANMLDLQIGNPELFDNYYCEPQNNILYKI